MISFGQLGVDQDQSHMSRNALIQADKLKTADLGLFWNVMSQNKEK